MNPVALITGATSGVGAACARDIASRAEGGLILVDIDEAALDALADKLETSGVAPERVSTLAFDVTDPEWWRRGADFIKGHYGRLDWAVVNAEPAKPTPQTDLVAWGNPSYLEGAILTLQHVMPLMRGNALGGAIVISAPATSVTTENVSAAKAGLLQVTRAAAKESASDNIRINAIASDGVETPALSAHPWFQDLVRETGSERGAFEKIAQLSPALARYAKSSEIQRLVIMLLSDENPISGATLVVDAGYAL